jgi:hypothetical protein
MWGHSVDPITRRFPTGFVPMEILGMSLILRGGMFTLISELLYSFRYLTLNMVITAKSLP